MLLEKIVDLLQQEDREHLMKRINVTKSKKILITHGTFTMKETAKYLAKLSLGKTIVLTGALILGTDKHTDASFNLGFAISALEFLDKGVYIAMNGKVFSWDNVRKNLETNRFEKLYE